LAVPDLSPATLLTIKVSRRRPNMVTCAVPSPGPTCAGTGPAAATWSARRPGRSGIRPAKPPERPAGRV